MMMQEEISKFVITELNKKNANYFQRFTDKQRERESNKNIQIKVIFLKFD